MADRLGITRQAYNNYERDKRHPDYETLLKIAKILDVDIRDLLGVDKEEGPDIEKLLAGEHGEPKYKGKPLSDKQIELLIPIIETIVEKGE